MKTMKRVVRILGKKIHAKTFVILLILNVYLFIYMLNSHDKLNLIVHHFDAPALILKSKCQCKPPIIIFKYDNIHKYGVNSTRTKDPINTYNISSLDDVNLSCDLYNVLRRGRAQKILAFSLYGKDRFYYDKLFNLTRQVKQLYPEWIMRIYYDSSIDQSIICEIECLNDQHQLIDNVDFCFVEELDVKLSARMDETTMISVHRLNATYIHAMMWRWFPIGDSFVDVFSSRDSDSHIIQREIDAVNEWLVSDKQAHIMRDSIGHGSYMLGGLWGFYNARAREMSRRLFSLITSPRLSALFNPDSKSPKEADQNFLSDYVYPLVKANSLIHNSYFCKNPKLSGTYFPTKRVGNCFVGNPYECDKNNFTIEKCPVECRPPSHKDWEFC